MKHPMAHKIKKPFDYIPSGATDIRKTFAKARASQKKIEELKEHFTKVTPIRKGEAK